MRWVSLQGCCDLFSCISVSVLCAQRGAPASTASCPSLSCRVPSLSSVSSVSKRSWSLLWLHLLLPQEWLHMPCAVFSSLAELTHRRGAARCPCLACCPTEMKHFCCLVKQEIYLNSHHQLWNRCRGVSRWHPDVVQLKYSYRALLGPSRCSLTDLAGAICTVLQICSKVRPSGCGADC